MNRAWLGTVYYLYTWYAHRPTHVAMKLHAHGAYIQWKWMWSTQITFWLWLLLVAATKWFLNENEDICIYVIIRNGHTFTCLSTYWLFMLSDVVAVVVAGEWCNCHETVFCLSFIRNQFVSDGCCRPRYNRYIQFPPCCEQLEEWKKIISSRHIEHNVVFGHTYLLGGAVKNLATKTRCVLFHISHIHYSEMPKKSTVSTRIIFFLMIRFKVVIMK